MLFLALRVSSVGLGRRVMTTDDDEIDGLHDHDGHGHVHHDDHDGDDNDGKENEAW